MQQRIIKTRQIYHLAFVISLHYQLILTEHKVLCLCTFELKIIIAKWIKGTASRTKPSIAECLIQNI